MTTIVADLRTGQMGSDLFVSNGSRVMKMWRCKEGVFGAAGDERAIQRFKEWTTEGGERPPQIKDDADDGDSFEALQLKDGKLFVWGWAIAPEESVRLFHAVGSGGQYALGALLQGASIEEALEIAAEFDGNTKPPFRILKAN